MSLNMQTIIKFKKIWMIIQRQYDISRHFCEYNSEQMNLQYAESYLDIHILSQVQIVSQNSLGKQFRICPYWRPTFETWYPGYKQYTILHYKYLASTWAYNADWLPYSGFLTCWVSWEHSPISTGIWGHRAVYRVIVCYIRPIRSRWYSTINNW